MLSPPSAALTNEGSPFCGPCSPEASHSNSPGRSLVTTAPILPFSAVNTRSNLTSVTSPMGASRRATTSNASVEDRTLSQSITILDYLQINRDSGGSLTLCFYKIAPLNPYLSRGSNTPIGTDRMEEQNMARCKNCNRTLNALTYLIDVRHQLGWCSAGGEEE